MKSNIKLLIAAACVLVLLICGVVILNLTGKNDDEADVSETTTTAAVESKLLYDKDPAQISNIHVKNETGEYDIKKFGDDAWFVADFVGQVHNTSAVSEAINSAATMTSQQVASENAEDMSVYGLSEPRAVVTVDFDSETKTINIGADAPTSGLVYISYGSEKTVHAVKKTAVSCFFNDRFSFINRTVYTAKQGATDEETAENSKINKITVSRKDIDYDIVLEYDPRQDSTDVVSGNSATHVMTSPVKLDLNPDNSYEFINNVFNLTASSIAVISPSEEMKANFGLDDPFATVDYDIVGGDFRLYIGNTYTNADGVESGYFGYAEGIDIIYIFDKSSLPWAYQMPLDIAMSMITSNYIYNVESIDIASSDKQVHFELSGDSEDFKVSVDGKDIDPDSFKSFYQFILKTPGEELYIEPCDKPADLTVTIKTADKTDTLEFISSEDRLSIIKLNGDVSFRCRTAYVSRLEENLEHLLNGENLVETW